MTQDKLDIFGLSETLVSNQSTFFSENGTYPIKNYWTFLTLVVEQRIFSTQGVLTLTYFLGSRVAIAPRKRLEV